MHNVGFSEQDLYEIGVTAHLESSAILTAEVLNEIDSKSVDEVKAELHVAESHAILRAIAVMIAKNNQLVSKQLQELGVKA